MAVRAADAAGIDVISVEPGIIPDAGHKGRFLSSDFYELTKLLANEPGQ